MIDVHRSHKAIHGFGEFFLHLFTITIGLLIAVGIEATIERHHQTELADQAQETMTTEIRKNEASIVNALKTISREQQQAKVNLEAIAKVQTNADQDASVDVSRIASRSTTSRKS